MSSSASSLLMFLISSFSSSGNVSAKRSEPLLRASAISVSLAPSFQMAVTMTPYWVSNFLKALTSSSAGMLPLRGRESLSLASKINFGRLEVWAGGSLVSVKVKTAKPRLFNSVRAVFSSGASTVPLKDFPSEVATVYLNVAICEF